MDEPTEQRQFRDLFARHWGALLKWLALLVVGLAVVVTLVSIGDLELWLVIVLGALGALIGDSCLYWIPRRSSSGRRRTTFGEPVPWRGLEWREPALRGGPRLDLTLPG